MADDAVISLAADGLSPGSDIEITLEEVSGNTEEHLDDDGEKDFEIDTSDLFGNEKIRMLDVKSTDLQSAIQQVLGIETSDLENDIELGINGVDLDNDNEHITDTDEIQHNDQDNNSHHTLGVRGSDNENATDTDTAIMDGQTDDTQGKSYLPPAVGMEFETYDDAYNYYNCYAKELGFGIRVKSSWTKRNSKEKRGAVLSCNCEGFKALKEANTRRKETRTGCLAMVRLRLVESNRWRLDEVKLEHNHLFDHERAQNSRSHKKVEAGTKRKLELAVDIEVQTIKLYRTPAVDTVSYGSLNEGELSNHVELLKCLKLGKSDTLALNNYFRQAQLVDPNFFYIMDLSDEGYLRNVFWIDSRSRAAYGYFGDVVVVDSTCLSNKHDIPLLAFSGLNHHGQSVLLGCGLLVDESMETYLWLMRAWLTCISGHPPQTIITDQCKVLQNAISEVFPRAHHRLCLPLVMQTIHKRLGEVGESEIFRTILNRIVNNSLKVEEFEMAWEEMIQHFAIRDNEWVQSVYEDRERWVPVYSKDTLFAGIYTSQQDEHMLSFFHGYLREQTTLNDFFSIYELLQQEKIKKEAFDDSETREFRPFLRTSCNYELLLSELYTKEIFLKFQEEVVLMSICFSITQIHVNGAIITYMVKERVGEGDTREAKNFEVVYDKVGLDVRCVCSCFNYKGYLCRHALSVLKYNGVEEIPNQYILTRWRKDLKRLYTLDPGSNNVDITNPVQWFDHLYRRAMQVVAEGMKSEDHHMVAWQAFKETLNKVRLMADKTL